MSFVKDLLVTGYICISTILNGKVGTYVLSKTSNPFAHFIVIGGTTFMAYFAIPTLLLERYCPNNGMAQYTNINIIPTLLLERYNENSNIPLVPKVDLSIIIGDVSEPTSTNE